MDNFMDKLAQKFSAQEIIKANSHAEAEEMKRLQMQVSEYEKILQEMRKLNYKNTELSEKLDALIGENAGKIQGMKEDEQKLLLALRDLTDEQTRNREAELERKEEERLEREREAELKKENDISALTALLEEKFQRSDDFVHKENVKVYRNVQAVVVDELKKYIDNTQGSDAKNEEKIKALNNKLNIVLVMSILSMIASVAGFAMWLITFGMTFGIFK